MGRGHSNVGAAARAGRGKAAPWEGGAWDFGPGGKRGGAGWGQAEAEAAPGTPGGKGPGTPPKAAVYMPPKRKNDQFSRPHCQTNRTD
jgi:hypothetical protein